MKLRIESFDHNEAFSPLLPRDGLVVSTPKCADSELVWHLLRLDDALLYEGAEYSHLLIASRWRGQPIGGSSPTSVFILLVPPSAIVTDGFSHESFRHVAWGMAHRIDGGARPAR